MRTFQEWTESQTARALPRWQYVLHLTETKNAAEIAQELHICRQRVYQLIKKARKARQEEELALEVLRLQFTATEPTATAALAHLGLLTP